MANNNLASGKPNRQRGAALILVLIALSVGSLLITPTLNYVYTGLNGIQIKEGLLLDQYTADAAIEYGLWQLEYDADNITDLLDMANPSENTTITVNGENVTLSTELSLSATSGNGSFTIPPTESGIHLAVGLDVLPDVWTKAGNKAYQTHIIYIYNYGTSATHVKALFQELDPMLNYVPGSYDGPDAAFTKTPVDDYWTLYWEFDTPLPKVNPQDWLIIMFTTWSFEAMGEQTYEGSGWVEYAGFQEEEIVAYSGESGPVSVGLYDLTVSFGSCTMLVNVGITETGEVVIRSWQVE